jgi:hypothetical protein
LTFENHAHPPRWHGESPDLPSNFMSRAILRAFLAGIALVLACGSVCAADEPAPTEAQVKAAYLYNFAKFIEWPADAFADTNSPIAIGVLTDRSFTDELERTVRNKTVDGRKLVVKFVKNLSESKSCQMLFVSADEKQPLRRILDAVQLSSVLTVGETEHFTENGGIINFVMDGKRVRFEINRAEARRARLKISPRLLKLAVNQSEITQ